MACGRASPFHLGFSPLTSTLRSLARRPAWLPDRKAGRRQPGRLAQWLSDQTAAGGLGGSRSGWMGWGGDRAGWAEAERRQRSRRSGGEGREGRAATARAADSVVERSDGRRRPGRQPAQSGGSPVGQAAMACRRRSKRFVWRLLSRVASGWPCSSSIPVPYQFQTSSKPVPNPVPNRLYIVF